MYVYFNSNPVGNRVGDCSVRAVSKVLGISWDDAFDLLADAAKAMGDMPSSNNVISAVLRGNGFYRENLPSFCPDCYTVKEFAYNNPVGTYVLNTGNHVVAVVNGNWFDAWDSGDEIPLYFWTR